MLILDVLVVFATFMKHLKDNARLDFLKQKHKYEKKKEITPFLLIQSIGMSLREDEPSEK